MVVGDYHGGKRKSPVNEIKGKFPFAEAEEAKKSGDDEYYFLVKAEIPELVAGR